MNDTALRLAGKLQQQAVWEGHYGPSYLRELLPEAAAELRRLNALNAELVEALKRISFASPDQLDHAMDASIIERCAKIARAALAKVEASK